MTTEQPLHSATAPLGRPAGFALDEGYDVAYAYDVFGRFQCVTASVSSASLAVQYSRLPDSDLLESTSFVQSGDLADAFTHRFSTKPWCPVTRLSEYEYRKYSATMGRWLSRDPIETRRDHNVTAFVRNDATDMWDYLGMTANRYEQNCQNVKAVLDRGWATGDPGIDDQVNYLRSAKCPFYIVCLPCCTYEDCNSAVARGCARKESSRWPWRRDKCRITSCANRYNGAPASDVYETIRHELTHCVQFCDGSWDEGKGSCRACVCLDLQAGYNGNPSPNLPRRRRIHSAWASCIGKGKPCNAESPTTVDGMFTEDEYRRCLTKGTRP